MSDFLSLSKLKIKKEYCLLFSYVLSILITILVYFTGGTIKVYSNLMYLPISIVSSTGGKNHGLLHATISALLLGPFMPLDVALDIGQEPINWVVRMLTYIIVALVIGFFSDHYREEFQMNSNKDKEILETQMATIFALVKLSESRDDYTGSHIERVSSFCQLLAEKLQANPEYGQYINEEYIENIYKASPLHDVGKVGIPDNILLKPGKLSKEEFAIMKTHTTIGANTLLEVKNKFPNNKFLELGISIATYHHEKWDGTGYPFGISGKEIPLSARIMALADVYDALRSKRVYKEAFSHEKSIEIINEGKGSHFDPILVSVFINNHMEFMNTYDKFRI